MRERERCCCRRLAQHNSNPHTHMHNWELQSALDYIRVMAGEMGGRMGGNWNVEKNKRALKNKERFSYWAAALL